MPYKAKPRCRRERQLWARLFNKNVKDDHSSVVQEIKDCSELCRIGGGLEVRARFGRESVRVFSYARA